MSFLRKAVDGEVRKAQAVSKLATQWAKDHPALHEYLTAVKYPSGEQRLTATILLFVDDGVVKICLNDRDTSQSLWVSSGSIPEALIELEATLSSGGGEWRRNREWGGSKNKKKAG